MPSGTAQKRWTCDRCEVTVRWAAGAENPHFPEGWVKDGGAVFCLGCRRELAGEAGVDAMPEGTNDGERLKHRTRARIEFEIQRDPERRDNAIAKACKTSIVAVKRARERMGQTSPS